MNSSGTRKDPNANATLVDRCANAGLRITGQRRVITEVLDASSDHPDVEELHRRSVALDENISISTVYRTLKLLEELDLIARHDFRDGKARYETVPEEHHDHLIDLKTGRVIEFTNEEIEAIQEVIARRLGYRLVDHRLELYGVPLASQTGPASSPATSKSDRD
ncbi:MAG: Fur family transcriptional regulator [Pseudomonadota bacterium]